MKKIKAEEYMNWDKNIAKEITPLDAFKRIKQHHEIKGMDNNGVVSVVGYINEKELDIIETALKALEIIKEHRLDIDWFLQFVRQDISYKHYVYCVEQGDNKFAKRFLLSEKEYDLLKEVLL